MERNVAGLQAEIGRLTRLCSQQQQHLQQLDAECKRLSEQGAIMEGQKITSLAWLITMLLEHHDGEVVLTVPLVEEIAGGKIEYGTKTEVSKDGQTMRLMAIDSQGNTVDKPAPAVREGVKTRKAQLAADAASAQAEAEVVICPDCLRRSPAHNLDCPQQWKPEKP